jgi:hypothetical protein
MKTANGSNLDITNGSNLNSPGDTNLNITTGSNLNITTGSNLNITTGSNLNITTGSNLNITTGSYLNIDNGSNLNIANRSNLNSANGGSIRASTQPEEATEEHRILKIVPSNENIIKATLNAFQRETPSKQLDIAKFIKGLPSFEKRFSMNDIAEAYINVLLGGLFKIVSLVDVEVIKKKLILAQLFVDGRIASFRSRE